MPILNFKKLLQSLEQAEVRFLLVGGMAAIGHGMNYNTNDLDICYQRSADNYSALVKALRPANPSLRTAQGDIPFLFDEKTLKNGLNFTLQTDWGPIDLLGELEKVGNYESLKPGCTIYEFYGVQVQTISLEDLILAKKIANRVKDQLHLLQLEALRDLSKDKDSE